MNVRQFISDLVSFRHMPGVTVDLMLRETAGNDPFYEQVVRDYYASTRKRHPKFPLVRIDEYGVALFRLPPAFEEYFMGIEASARRNYKKAARMGYRFEKIDYNVHLDSIREIWQSKTVRQGKVPDYLLQGAVSPCENPPSRSNIHDYAYFGVLQDRTLVAYLGCLVSGEMCAIEQIYGHAEHHPNGVVPMLIIDLVRNLPEQYPQVKYVTYDTFLGAGRNLRRFKRKFRFAPHRVTWDLG